MSVYLLTSFQGSAGGSLDVTDLGNRKGTAAPAGHGALQFSPVAQSCPTLPPHGPHHTRPPCPSPAPGACSNSCPLSQWCHPPISSSVVPFSSCLQSFPASGSFPISLHQVAKVLELLFSISLSNEYSGLISFGMDWLDLLAFQRTLKSLLQHHSSKALILQCSVFLIVQLSHPYTTTGKIIALTRRTFISKVMSLLFNMLSKLVIAFLSRSKCLLMSWLQSPSAVILEPLFIYKVSQCFHCFPIYVPWSDGTRCHDLSFLNWVLSQLFHSPLSLSSRGSLVLL